MEKFSTFVSHLIVVVAALFVGLCYGMGYAVETMERSAVEAGVGEHRVVVEGGKEKRVFRWKAPTTREVER